MSKSTRYILRLNEHAAPAEPTEMLVSTGAKIIASRPGLILIEATAAAVEQLRESLVDWQITEEVIAKVPSPRPNMPQ